MENITINSAMIVNHTMLNALRKEKNLTFKGMEDEITVPEGTIKNVLLGKTKNPSGDTMNKICKVLGVSVEDAYIPIDSSLIKTHLEVQGLKENDVNVIALKEIYEYQIAQMKESNEEHIRNIREHYERHIAEIKEHYEKRLADKREHIETILLDKKWFRLASVFGILTLLGVFFFIEFMTPGHGWFTFVK